MSLNIPAGLWGKTQFTADEVQASRKISAARIHVERAIGYLKNFKILRNTVSRKLLPYLSEIVFVCAQLVNMQPVTLREVDEHFRRLSTSG